MGVVVRKVGERGYDEHGELAYDSGTMRLSEQEVWAICVARLLQGRR
jgi:hypothetical protein